MSRALIAALVLALVPATTPAAPPNERVLEHLTDLGGAISLGFGVTPLRPQLASPVAPVPADLDLQSTALSFDLKLKWPGSDVVRSLEPYLVVGPALFVVEPDYVSRLLGTRVDPALRLGAKAGAGVNWHLGRDLTLFGAYEATTGAGPLGTRTPADSAITGYDFTYGLRLRY
jgi:hypothetical protein